MNNVGQRSTAVMASGVIAILGSLVTAIGILIGMMGLLLSFGRPNPMETIPGVRVMTAAMMVVFFAITIWGAFSGVGVVRFRNWARISVLIWSGITAPICLLAIAFMAFIPLPTPPDSPVTNTMIRLVVVIFYGAPLAIAVWWLILFTRSGIVAQFRQGPAGASGDPFTAIPVSAPPDGSVLPEDFAVPGPLPGPSVPIPIIVLACFFLVSALSIFFIFFMHMPAMVFGHAFTGLTGSVVYATWCVLYAVAGVGMLKRVSWAYSIAIGLQILGIVSGIMTLLSPDFDNVMRRAMSSMRMPPPDVYQMQSMAHLRGFSFIGLLFPLAILGMLAYYRPRFLDSAQRTPATPQL
ncbi:MAG TPA: hypothetical protein VMP12_00115 [Candidatus Sulfotelmatobacter sp.]|nr:hypothetical protein [Candidatus Sulfotelmatobacter sp.]